MASLRIPKKHHRGFEKLLRLSEDGFQHFISGIVDMAMTLKTKEVITKAVSDIKDIPAEHITSITDAVISLTLAKATSDTESEEFVNELIEAIGENYELANLIDEVGVDTIKARLETLFSISPLSIAAKASSVMYEYENVYYKSRAITDIRPIFSTEIDSVEAALIIHTLRIHYHMGDSHKDFYVALDTDDLQQLIDVLERAKSKAEKLKAMLALSDTPHFESPER